MKRIVALAVTAVILIMAHTSSALTTDKWDTNGAVINKVEITLYYTDPVAGKRVRLSYRDISNLIQLQRVLSDEDNNLLIVLNSTGNDYEVNIGLLGAGVIIGDRNNNRFVVSWSDEVDQEVGTLLSFDVPPDNGSIDAADIISASAEGHYKIFPKDGSIDLKLKMYISGSFTLKGNTCQSLVEIKLDVSGMPRAGDSDYNLLDRQFGL